MTTLHLRKSIGRSPLQLAFIVISLAFACFALSPTAQAVTPAPDGGYSGQNTAEGDDALFSLTTGADNTAIGFDALYSNTTGSQNTAIGINTLFSNTTGNSNMASGASALLNNTTGSYNTATGVNVLLNNTTGEGNTASGWQALSGNTTGIDNTANGLYALYSNTTGSLNTANGIQALWLNTSGIYNTANGANALYSNTIGVNNTASGQNALLSNTTGNYNTADGQNALGLNTVGLNNTACGQSALRRNTTGSFNVALGANAGKNLTTGDNNIDIANLGVPGEAQTIRIGKQGIQTTTLIAGISGATVPGGVSVIIDSTGHLGTVVSSERFKDAIKPMANQSEAILALKPVTFHYKHELDPEGIPQFGLVAEQVEKVNPDLVARDAEGKVYTVRYEAVNAMLLNEFLKEHRKVEEQEATIAKQQKQIEALGTGLQKVSDELELRKPAPQMVLNNQ